MGEGNEFYTEWTESYDSFDQMNLHENLLRGIYAYGALITVPLVVVIVLEGPEKQWSFTASKVLQLRRLSY